MEAFLLFLTCDKNLFKKLAEFFEFIVKNYYTKMVSIIFSIKGES